MSDEITNTITADDAINKAFSYFDQYIRRNKQSVRHVPLEGFEPLGGEWMVSISFDEGRFKQSSSPLEFGKTTKEPLREIRNFYISSDDGSLKRVNAS